MRTTSKAANKALEDIARIAREEYEDPEDQYWLKKVMLDAFEAGYDAATEDTLGDLAKFHSGMTAYRLVNSRRNMENQDKWEKMTPAMKEGQRKLAIAVKDAIKKGEADRNPLSHDLGVIEDDDGPGQMTREEREWR